MIGIELVTVRIIVGTLRCTALACAVWVAVFAGGTAGLSCATGEMVCGPAHLSVAKEQSRTDRHVKM